MFTNTFPIVFAYLLGSLSSAIFVAKALKLPDPRESGSQNPGATNMLRIGGKRAAGLTFMGDALKGFLPVTVALIFGTPEDWLGYVALAAFMGHIFPVFFNFKGGKGVATSFGCFMGLSPWLGLSSLGLWILVVAASRYSSLGAIVTALFVPLFTWLFAPGALPAVVVMCVLLLLRHQENMLRLIKGHEKKI